MVTRKAWLGRSRLLAFTTATAILLERLPPALARETPSAPTATTGQEPTKPRNIIFVLIDDLRCDGIGFLPPQIRMPGIDRMALEGSYYPNIVVTSAPCSPSRATILTGKTARNHGIVDHNDPREAGLTASLQQVGYRTAFVGKWLMGNASNNPRAGVDKGVDFHGNGACFSAAGVPGSAKASGATNMLNVDGREVAQKGYITDELTDYAISWLDKARGPAVGIRRRSTRAGALRPVA